MEDRKLFVGLLESFQVRCTLWRQTNNAQVLKQWHVSTGISAAWKGDCLHSPPMANCWSMIWSWRSICCNVSTLQHSSYRTHSTHINPAYAADKAESIPGAQCKLMPRLERYSHPNKIWFNLRKIYNSKFVHFQAFVICTVDLRENISISAGWLASPPTKQLMLLIYCYSHACRFQTVHCHKVYWIPSKNFAKIHVYGKRFSSPVDTRRTQWKHRLTSLAELVASLHLSLKATVIFNILGEGIPLKRLVYNGNAAQETQTSKQQLRWHHWQSY